MLKDGSYLLLHQFNTEPKAEKYWQEIKSYVQHEPGYEKEVKFELPEVFKEAVISNRNIEIRWKNKGKQAFINILLFPIFFIGIVTVLSTLLFKYSGFETYISVAFISFFSLILLFVGGVSLISSKNMWQAENFRFKFNLDESGVRLTRLDKIGQEKSTLFSIPLENLIGFKMDFVAPGNEDTLKPQLEFLLTSTEAQTPFQEGWQKIKQEWRSEILHFKSFTYIDVLNLRNYMNQELKNLKD